MQLIFACIALLFNVSKIKPNIKGLLLQSFPFILLLAFSFIYLFHFDSRVPTYSSYKRSLYFWNIAIIVISIFVVNNKKEFIFLVILANIQIISTILIDFVTNNFNLFLLREEYIVTGRLLGGFILSYFLFLRYQVKQKYLVKVLGVLTLLSIILLFLSGSRAPIIVLLFLFGYKFLKDKSFNIKLLYILLASFVYIIIANTKILIFEGNLAYLNRLFSILTSDVSVSEFSNGRFDLLKIILDNDIDFFIGNGVGSTAWMLIGEDVRIYPHNLIFEIFAELGAIGLSLIVSLIVLLLRQVNSYLALKNEIVIKKFINYFISYSLFTALFSLEFPNQFMLFQSIAYLFIINKLRVLEK